MKKIFLYAYDKQNLGDDLFVHTITKRYPGAQFYMWSDRDNRRVYQALPNLKVLDKDGLWVHFLQKLRPSLVSRYRSWLEKRCQAVVYIGGSIFMEYENWEQILTWWEYEAKNRPFYIMGANFGPYKSEGFRNKLAEIFGNARDICFRDRYSYEKFKDVPTVRCAPDILFSYPMPKVPVVEKQLFVSLIDCESRGEGESSLAGFNEYYISTLCGLLKTYLNDGFHVVLAAFCKNEGDEHAIKKLLDAMNLTPNMTNVKVLSYDGTNAEALTTALAESEYVIATRFHAAVLAIAAGRPVFPIVYSDKTIHVLEDIGFQGNYADLRRMTSITYAESRANLDKPQTLDVGRLAEHAQEHFELLDLQMS